jgi:N-acetylneuraminic acid mutarotase
MQSPASQAQGAWSRVLVLTLAFHLTSLIPITATELARPEHTSLPALIEPIASFGAAVADDHLYVYSGHTGKAHEHSRRNLSPHFRRLKLTSNPSWEALPIGPALQSVALVAYRNKVYRVGGMLARNEPSEEDDLLSVPDFAEFDPIKNSWRALRPLPTGRSSHDAVVVGDTLYVVGGWQLDGDTRWHNTSLSLRLDDPNATWVELPKQPFERRALAVVEHRGVIYTLGGMNSAEVATTEVHGFDIAKQSWFVVQSLPGKPLQGFGCAAISFDGRLLVTTMNGEIHELNAEGTEWNTVGKLSEPRFFHRLASHRDAVWAIAGANQQRGHLASLERLTLNARIPFNTMPGVQP